MINRILLVNAQRQIAATEEKLFKDRLLAVALINWEKAMWPSGPFMFKAKSSRTAYPSNLTLHVDKENDTVTIKGLSEIEVYADTYSEATKRLFEYARQRGAR